MRRRCLQTGHLVVALVLFLATGILHAEEPPLDPAKVEFFEQKIRPLLTEHCLSCHGPDNAEAGLRLDLREGWKKGGDSGQAINPGKPQESLIIRMVKGPPTKMPPDSVLPEPLIADLVKWIEQGAVDPRDGTITTAERKIDWEASRKFWAYQPVQVVEPPPSKDPHSQLPIDRFISAKWQKAGVQPSPLADKTTLIRRACFTLTGLPPTYEEVQAFEKDNAPDAFDKVIDRLLSSPRYGEHQARQWLDLVRYGEDKFSMDDQQGANPWRYRDWVIKAFNEDMSYDQFVKLQLAADVIDPSEGGKGHRAALGLLALGPTTGVVNNNDLAKPEEWADRIDVLSRGFLGLTVACARCHDHKYDPIPTEDYYALAGIMASNQSVIADVSPPDGGAFENAKKALDEAEMKSKAYFQSEADRLAMQAADTFPDLTETIWRFHAKQLDEPALKAEDFAKSENLNPVAFVGVDNYLLATNRGPQHYLAKWPELLPKKDGPREPTPEIRQFGEMFRDKVKENLSQEITKRNLDQQHELFGEKGPFPFTESGVLAVANDGWKNEYTQHRQRAKEAKDRLPPEPIRCVSLAENNPRDIQLLIRGNHNKRGPVIPRHFLTILAGDNPPPFSEGSGRKALAEAIASPTNPLTARVIVNRLWQQHFGQGIVATASNFGELGSRPTHPELLDYLAAQFVKEGWSIKKLHRHLLQSAAFRRTSLANEQNLRIDPENAWLWRFTPRRHTVEVFRDSVLSAAGVLNLEGGGQSDNLDEMTTTRRTLFGKVSRSSPSKLLTLWDCADPNISTDRRNVSTLPQQMLFLMNSPFMIDYSRKVAQRIDGEAAPADRVRRAYELILSRAPTAAELKIIVPYLEAEDAVEEDKARNGLSRTERFVQSLLSSNEFFFLN